MEKKATTRRFSFHSIKNNLSKEQLTQWFTAATWAYALPTFFTSLEETEKVIQKLGLLQDGARETLPGADHASSFIFGAMLMSYCALEESLCNPEPSRKRQVLLFGGLVFATAVNTIGELLQHQPNPELPAEVLAGIGGSLAARSLFRSGLVNQILTKYPSSQEFFSHLSDNLDIA